MIQTICERLSARKPWGGGMWIWLFLLLFLIPSCGNLPGLPGLPGLPDLLDPSLENARQVELPNGNLWRPPVGCTTPWGIAESAQDEANIKRIDEFPGDADWVNVSGNGEPDNPLVIVGDLVVTKMVRIREGSSYVILDGLTIHPEPSRDFEWTGSGVLIEGGTHHIAVRNCILRSTSNADVSQSSATSGADVTQPPATGNTDAPQPPRHRTLLTTDPSQGRTVEHVTVFNCTIGPLGDWTQNEGADYAGMSFSAGTKHVRVFDCAISDISGDAIGFPSESMLAARGYAEFPATNIQIGRCLLQRCKENLIDGKLVQDIIISECTLEKTNSFSTSSRPDAIVLQTGPLQQIIDDHGGALQWMSPNNAWLLFNDIRDLSRGAIFTTETFTPDDRKGTMYSVGNRWTNIRAEGRGSGTGLIAGNGNLVLSFSDTFSNVDTDTSSLPSGVWPARMVVTQGQIPQEEFRQEFGRDLGGTP